MFTDTLGLEPRFVDVAGQPRIRKGKTLEFVPTESYWSHEFDTDGEQDIEDYLLRKAADMAPYQEFFRRICATGGRVEFFVGFFVESPNCGFVLSPELQRKCSESHLSLSFDIYGLYHAQAKEQV